MEKQTVYLVFQEVLKGVATSINVVGVFADHGRAQACADRRYNRWVMSKTLIPDLAVTKVATVTQTDGVA